MNCQVEDCKKKAKVICEFHSIKLCSKHYVKHCRTCEEKPIHINIDPELKKEQINNLSRKVALAKKQILALTIKLMCSINKSVNNALICLDKQKAEVMKIIEMSKPQNQFKEIDEMVQERILKIQDDFKSQIDLEIKLNLADFKVKIQAINRKPQNPPAVVTLMPIPQSNPVLESLENNDIDEKIKMYQDQGLHLYYHKRIQEIKITTDSNFVFTCEIK